MQKTCTKCGEAKEESLFAKGAWTPICKLCRNAQMQEYYQRNKEEKLARDKRYVAENRAKVRDRHQAWRKKNVDKVNAYERKSYNAAPAKHHAKNARRKAMKLCATPKWANEFFIEEAYDLAIRRTKMLGFPWQVDHIVPLISKRVCGLHVENNLRVIPKSENSAKGNRYWPDT